MYRRTATIFALLTAALVAGAEPVASFRWDAETSTPRAQKVRVARGASLALVARLQSYGKPIALPPGAMATFCWQTNGMASAWWTTNAVVSTNGTLRAVWDPSMDAGAREYSFFLRVETDGGIDYSARGGLSIDPSPGLSPAAAPALPEAFPYTPLALSGSAAAAAEPVALVRWEAETSSPQPFAVRTLRGESLALEPQLVTYRRRAELPAGASAVFCYQTNGMGSAWWTAPATARSDGLLRAVWTPQMDAGASEYNFFFRVESSEGLDYSAYGGLRVLPSPGRTPNTIEFPVQTLDFSAIDYANAPWATAAEALQASADAIRDAVSALDSGHADSIDEVGELLLSLVEKLKQINQENHP